MESTRGRTLWVTTSRKTRSAQRLECVPSITDLRFAAAPVGEKLPSLPKLGRFEGERRAKPNQLDIRVGRRGVVSEVLLSSSMSEAVSERMLERAALQGTWFTETTSHPTATPASAAGDSASTPSTMMRPFVPLREK